MYINHLKTGKSALTIVLLCLWLAACSSPGDGDAMHVDVLIKDHKFFPSIVQVPEGKKIIITLRNQDTTIEEFESTDLKREKIVLGNSEIKIKLAPLKAGEYKFFGDFHQDTAQGKIIVTKN